MLALLLCAAGYAIQFAMFPSTDDQDAAMHAMFARFPDTYRILSAFARPLFASIYVIPGVAGYQVMRAFTLIICVALAWIAYRTACRLGLLYPWLAIPFVLTQPALYHLGVETMTEPTFALVLAVGLYLVTAGRRVAAAIMLSLLPLARPEGPIVLIATAACWLHDAPADRKTLLATALLGTGLALWWVVSVLATGEAGYLIRTFPWTVDTPAVHGRPFDYLLRWPAIVGDAVCAFSAIGIVAGWRNPTLRIATVATLAVFALHSYLWAAGRFASWGFVRYFATLAPCTALLALRGVGVFARTRVRIGTAAVSALLLLQVIQAFYTNIDALNYVSFATRSAARDAAMRFDLYRQGFVSADHFGYVFADVSENTTPLPVGDSARVAGYLRRRPPGTVVLWDDVTGASWYHLSADAIPSLGYRVVWDHPGQRVGPARPARTFYTWLGWFVYDRSVRETILVRQ